jgi:hypothetical protein
MAIRRLLITTLRETMRTPIFLLAAMTLTSCTATAPPLAPVSLAASTTAAPSAALEAAARPTTAAAANPSAGLLRQAIRAGYHIRKLGQGIAVFCKNEPRLGSRFTVESCIDEVQLQEILIRTQDQQDKLSHRRGTGTDYN